MHSRRTEHLRESRERVHRALTVARLHRGTVERNLKTAPAEVDDKITVARVVERLRRTKHLTPLLASHWPHGLGRAHAERLEQQVDRLQVLHRGATGVAP